MIKTSFTVQGVKVIIQKKKDEAMLTLLKPNGQEITVALDEDRQEEVAQAMQEKDD